MNVLLNFAGSLLYYVFMFFFLPLFAVLLALLACHRLVLFIYQVIGYMGKLATHLHLVRKQLPARRLGRRLATVHA